MAINPDKLELIDYTHDHLGLSSFADLGGVWGVDGAYTFYALERHHPARAALVDTDFTPAVREQQPRFPMLSLIESNFGAADVPARIGPVDAVFLFDVLLHQVSPNWDQVLEMYAMVARTFVVFNQQFQASERTVRLLDLGEEEYFRNVPHDRQHPTYRALFDHPQEIHPQHQRPWRDIHNVWQWGIVDDDLLAVMKRLGYRLEFFKNCGRFCDLPNFENHAFVFHRRS
jgi:hypothetical protein